MGSYTLKENVPYCQHCSSRNISKLISLIYNYVNSIVQVCLCIFLFIFRWVQGIIDVGRKEKGGFGKQHHFLPPKSEMAENCGPKLVEAWEKQVNDQGTNAKLYLVILKSILGQYLVVGLLSILQDLATLLQPFVLRELMLQYGQENNSTSMLWVYSILLCVSNLFLSLIKRFYFFILDRISLRMMASTTYLIFHKILTTTKKDLSSISTGNIIERVCHDAEAVTWGIYSANTLWTGPLQLLFVLFYLYWHMGIYVTLGTLIILVLSLIQFYFAKTLAKYRKLQYIYMDKRTSVISELLSGMRLVKMYCWEKPFRKLIDGIRKKEMGFLKNLVICYTLLSDFLFFGKKSLIAMYVLIYYYLGYNLKAEKLFPLVLLINCISSVMLDRLPWAIKKVTESLVSAKRIQDFLLHNVKNDCEIKESKVACREQKLNNHIRNRKFNKSIISLKGGNASWDNASPTLNNIDLEIKRGELVAVIGKIGSGKTSLLMALLGELPIVSENRTITGKIAFTGQESWIFSESIRQNVLFGNKMNKNKYRKVIDSCCLTKDIEDFTMGDETKVGERGVKLSGGQKARLSLARALYEDADIYLLDDPLSAVDVKVGEKLFRGCFKELLKHKTILLVTHQLQYLQQCDKIIVMDKGSIQFRGSYEEVLQSGIDLIRVLSEKSMPISQDQPGIEIKKDEKVSLKGTRLTDKNKQSKKSIRNEREIDQGQEDLPIGRVGLDVYWSYFRLGASRKILLFILIVNLIWQVISNRIDFTIAEWSETDSMNKTESIVKGRNDYPFVYVSLILTAFGIGLFRSLLHFTVALRISSNLYSKMCESVIGSPIRFFDSNSIGQILSRFTTGISTADNNLTFAFYNMTLVLLSLGGTFTSAIIVSPLSLIAIIPFTISLFYYRNYINNVKIEVCRRTGVAYNPFLGHINSVLSGLETIRAFHRENAVRREFCLFCNNYIGNLFTRFVLFNWFSARTHVASSLFACFCILTSASLSAYFKAHQIGLIIIYSLPLMDSIHNFFSILSQVELRVSANFL
ncbi:DgyrCDS4463 [Dimorphilus gyrociliatus]|uniref:DgyrCDS4463 n=1 Tax=Dimorphilus gyrociliatus TaxID=2664684 RepID=A0A7I8VII2_9ANNE|nr:DgyrCDS4463 [Dimorphilus gyrociliatus]